MMKQKLQLLSITILLLFQIQVAKAQEVFVNLAQVDGLDITPDNILNFQVISRMKTMTHALISGSIQYRSSTMSIRYQFECNLQPGVNMVSTLASNPHYTYSQPALRELFEQYKKLPEGIYQYCVSVKPNYSAGESINNAETECVYHKSTDVFLINLIDPDNNAKIYEFNPMLSWTVNYPFAAQLQYRLRVAPINKGQNTVAAITRNNPIYDEKNLMQMSQVYPVYAKPLVVNQPYAWTVDAYYKGILLGGAEPWKFTIVQDSILAPIPSDQSYYEFADHHGENATYAIDTIKLKYISYQAVDTMKLTMVSDKGDTVNYSTNAYALRPGMNFINLDLPGKASGLHHMKSYTLLINNTDGKKYKVPFIYVNPLFLKK